MAHGLSCSVACGILLDQGSNLCPLHWQADSSPLRHQGNPRFCFKFEHILTLESTLVPCTLTCFLQKKVPSAATEQPPEPGKQRGWCRLGIHSSFNACLHKCPFQQMVHLGAGTAPPPHLDFPDLDAFEGDRPLLLQNVPPFGFICRFLALDSGFAPGAGGVTTLLPSPGILSSRWHVVSKCPLAGGVGFNHLTPALFAGRLRREGPPIPLVGHEYS